MAVTFSVEEWVARPPAEVWRRLTDWENAGEWMPGVEHLKAAGPVAVGTQLRFEARGKERPSEITHLIDGEEITLTSRQGPVTASYCYRCVEQNGGTQVSLVADCEISGPLRLMGPLLRYAVKKTDGGQIAELKRAVERQ